MSTPSSLEEKTIAELERLFLLEPYQQGLTPQPVRKGLPSWVSFTLGVAFCAGLSYGLTVLPPAGGPVKSNTSTNLHPAMVSIDPNTVPVPAKNSEFELAITNNPYLSAHRTTVTGIADPTSMTAAYYLAMYVSNTSGTAQEAIMISNCPKVLRSQGQRYGSTE